MSGRARKKTRRMVSSACFCSVSACVARPYAAALNSSTPAPPGTFVPIVKIGILGAEITWSSQRDLLAATSPGTSFSPGFSPPTIGSEASWWGPLTLPLILPCVAYFAGCMVQRHCHHTLFHGCSIFAATVVAFSFMRLNQQAVGVALELDLAPVFVVT
jgi:hypothetical protein